MTNDFPHAGTVISGTMRPEDLIPAFMAKLNELNAERAAELAGQRTVLAQRGVDSFVADHCYLDDLQDALADLAPEGWYFGSIEGDGADYGFWRDLAAPPSEPARINGRWKNDA